MANKTTNNIIEIFISTCWSDGLDADSRANIIEQVLPKILTELENFKPTPLVQTTPVPAIQVAPTIPVMPAGGTGKVLQKVLENTGEAKKRGPIKGTTNRYQIFLKECCDWDTFKKANPAVTYPQFKTLMGPKWKEIDDAKTPEAKATSELIDNRKDAFEKWLLTNPGKKYLTFSDSVPMAKAAQVPAQEVPAPVPAPEAKEVPAPEAKEVPAPVAETPIKVV